MKIQCDVCNKDEASVFCLADEAALCAACDHRVHHANKLAGKHQRFSLLQPSPKQIPLCDICQEKRALLFCQEDRAILCRDCDSSIHKANPQTQKHNRFLLTGVKLSPTTSLYSSSSSSTSTESSLSNASDSVPNPVSQIPTKPPPSFTAKTTPLMIGSAAVAPPPPPSQAAEPTNDKGGGNIQLSTSSISEYFSDTLPGWHVEDFLAASPPGFFKTTENDVLSFLNADLGSNNLSTFPPENMGLWVPQTPSNPYFPTQIQSYQTINMGFGASSEGLKETTNMNKSSRQWSKEDNSFAVPQINPATSASKRSRNFW